MCADTKSSGQHQSRDHMVPVATSNPSTGSVRSPSSASSSRAPDSQRHWRQAQKARFAAHEHEHRGKGEAERREDEEIELAKGQSIAVRLVTPA